MLSSYNTKFIFHHVRITLEMFNDLFETKFMTVINTYLKRAQVARGRRLVLDQIQRYIKGYI